MDYSVPRPWAFGICPWPGFRHSRPLCDQRFVGRFRQGPVQSSIWCLLVDAVLRAQAGGQSRRRKPRAGLIGGMALAACPRMLVKIQLEAVELARVREMVACSRCGCGCAGVG